MRKFWASPRSLRVWSAGCATGEEPYSIAIAMAETLEFTEAWELNVLATDISRPALQQAERATYSPRQLAGLAPSRLENHFTRVADHYVVKPRIRNLVTFAPFNLVNQVYPGRFDCIFCMNVLIYFSKPQRTAIIERFQDYLEPGGFLFLGHAESLNGAQVNFRTIIHRDARVYQKPERVLTTETGPAKPAERSAR
jgi:chemotaxis protein methyltransferase CheR